MSKKAARSVKSQTASDAAPAAPEAPQRVLVGDLLPPQAPPERPEGLKRVAIESVRPEVDGGRFPVKRVVGEPVQVTADVFADGHDELVAFVLYRREGERDWREVPMRPLGNDRWVGEFTVTEPGTYRYTVRARIEPYLTWARDLRKRVEAGQDVAVELLVGAGLVSAAAGRAESAEARRDAERLRELAQSLSSARDARERAARVADPEFLALACRWGDEGESVRYAREIEVWVDRLKARFSAWYELFPRSTSPKAGRHGTFKDLVQRLPYIAGMGFDVVYLPPIHPIGKAARKGRNNALKAGPSDPGSPWAIGSAEGGHTAVHPQLGTLEDFKALVAEASRQGLEVALDIALQCSPDHPWLKEHPEWFKHRPDGSLRYAENPPKKYEDIYPLDFCCADWEPLWEEVRQVFRFWMAQGVRIFRVDNPHTKPFGFWEWLIRELRAEDPGLIFLAEAFTRPRLMYRLAKAGFNQSYNYFPWRNSKGELEGYFTELARSGVREFFRPNLWPNTPDILTEYLQYGGRAAFQVRHVLAATLGASYGIYGPAFELCVCAPKEAGHEEYLDSEKYELKSWRLDAPESIRDFIARVNGIRRENPALQTDAGLRFFPTDNEQLLCFGKQSGDNAVIVAVNLDPHHTQSGWVTLPFQELGLGGERPYLMQDLLADRHYLWKGARNYIELDPRVGPAHIFRLRRYVRTERDFDYFL